MTTIRLHNVTKIFGPESAESVGSRSVADMARKPKETGSLFQIAGKLPNSFRANALLQVNLEIRHGETLGILGPSGCGKTTLLKVIAGLITPDEGNITFDGEDMENVLPGERRIGIVFQDYALYPHMQSQENIGFFFRLHKREQEIPERVRQVSQIMGIGFDKLLSRKPPTLSGGERQRVAVARCIARDPHVFLFDEPLSNLDAKLRTQTRVELKRLLDRFHVTGVYVTHDQVEAIALCDRLALMREGRIEQVGAYERLMDRPDNTFVAAFLGTPPMNIFEGRWTVDGWQGKDLFLTLPPERRHPEGGRGVLGIRPQYVQIISDAPFLGRVTLVEPLVSERVLLVHLDCGSTGVVARVPITMSIRRGDSLNFSFDSDHVHLFDGLSGRRLD